MIGVLNRPTAPALLGAEFTALAAEHGVCGAQLAVVHDDQTMTFETGELEHGTGRPVTRDTAFPIGSVTKTFTATLAMILVADGDLELDEPLGGHLPELDDLGDLLTLRHVLSHTGGLVSGVDAADLAAASPRRYVAEHCRRHNLVLPPGGGFSYSNLGYAIAGRLIEAITGMSWAEAMESILLRPLGIAPVFITGDTATGHSVNLTRGRVQPVRQSLPPAEWSAGALAVGALDLVSLGRLHVPPGRPALLPTGLAAEMRRAVPAADPFGLADGWGLGLAVFSGGGPDRTSEWVGHDGNADGTACYLRVDPAGGWIIALTTNTNTGIGMWRDLLARLPDLGIPAPAVWGNADPAGGRGARTTGTVGGRGAPNYVGTYANGDSEYVVTRSNEGWRLAADGEDYTVAAGPDGLTFALLDPSGQRLPGGRFQRDPATGEISGVVVNGRVARRRRAAASAR